MFEDRFDAGRQLAQRLQEYKNNPDVVVLAIPHDGIEVGFALAQELHAPLDIVLSKKIVFPTNPEYAIGSVSLDSVFIEPQLLEISQEFTDFLMNEIRRTRTMLAQRYHVYKEGMPPITLKDKVVIVTDDGAAHDKAFVITLDRIRKSDPKKIIVAIPVASHDALPLPEQKADECICLLIPDVFYGVGQFYHTFKQVGDTEAVRLLHEANRQ